MTDEDSDDSDGRTATTTEPAEPDVTDDADESVEPVGDGGFAESPDGSAVEPGDEPTAEPGDEPLLKPSLRQFPWLRAAGAAVATIAVEYVLVVLVFVAGPSSMDSSAFDSLADELLQYAFMLYNAHHVPLITTATNQPSPGPR